MSTLEGIALIGEPFVLRTVLLVPCSISSPVSPGPTPAGVNGSRTAGEIAVNRVYRRLQGFHPCVRECAYGAPKMEHDGLSPLPHPLHGRLGLGVPNEWWPSGPLLKSFEAAGFALTQLPSPPASVLSDARYLSRHAGAARAALDTSGLVPIVHAPPGVLAGTPSLAHLAVRAERLGVTIAIENLAPTYPGPERLSDTPLVLRALVHRVGSPRIGLCLDLGHAHIVAGLKHAALEHLVRPVLDSVVLFHVHDNLGARWDRRAPAGLDPLRLDLHLPPGRGTLPWADVGALLVDHGAPLLLEVHPPNRPQPDELFASTRDLLSP